MESRVCNGRYQIDEVIGRGGMATVYKALDLKLGRPVALKVLHDHYATDPQFLRRFEHEAQSAANLGAHPNIIDIYDVGQDNDLHYIVMEYVPGRTLKQVIEESGPVPVAQAVEIAQQIADGLAAAHRRGLVHRDIKPQNIIVSPDGQVRIADFGIAKGARSAGLTDPGVTFGTAEYISPEQVQGQPATPQSDIYSLGVVLYEMLTGRLPFFGDTPIAIAMQHVQADPVAPRDLNPQIPAPLEAIVLRALAKDPAIRPASAAALGHELASYRERGAKETLMGTAVPRSAAPPSSPRPAREAAQRYPPLQRRSAPPPLYADEPRRGASCAIFVLGMSLLVGILALLYIVVATDFSQRIGSFLSSPTSQPSVGNPPPATTQPTPGAPTTTSAPLVLVPNVVDLSDTEAREMLNKAQLRYALNPAMNDPEVRQGFVISQDVPPNTQVPIGSVVTYTVSLGPKQVEIPDFTGQPFDVAKSQLEELGVQVVKREQPDPSVPAGTVISQSPGAGGILVNQPVTLIVSLGDVIVFPDVIGMQRDQAEQIISSTPGLTLAFVDEQGRDRLGGDFDRYKPNEVISAATADGQPVRNGQVVPRGSHIVLGVRAP